MLMLMLVSSAIEVEIRDPSPRRPSISLQFSFSNLRQSEMVLWVFGYGSLIWKSGFNYDERLVGCIKGYRRVFYQGSTDHRGTPEYPGRTVTLEPAEGENSGFAMFLKAEAGLLTITAERLQRFCCPDRVAKWGAAYKISNQEDIEIATTYLEVREKQYDGKAYLDFYNDSASSSPTVSGVLVYIASSNKKVNQNYLGPASIQEIAKQIVMAEGPSGPNKDYLFNLEKALLQMGNGCEDGHVMELADEVRRLLHLEDTKASLEDSTPS
ncbi:hypothetical protein V2J09_016918 [Rumex salicifolius]